MNFRSFGGLFVSLGLVLASSAIAFANEPQPAAADRKVVAYLPEFVDEPMAKYLRSLMSSLVEEGGWEVEFARCRNDFSDAGLSGPSVVCGLAATPDNRHRFEFPVVAAGRRRIDLYAAPEDRRFSNGVVRTSAPYRVGCLEYAQRARKLFADYAAANGIPYVYEVVESQATLTNRLMTGAVDFVLLPAAVISDVRRVGSCGHVDFHIVTPRGQTEAAHWISSQLKTLHLTRPGFFRELERQCFDPAIDEGRHVRMALFLERGICEQNTDGGFVGIVPDIVRKVEALAGWDLTLVPMTFDEAQQALKDGVVDLVGAIGRTDDRAAFCMFSEFNIGPLQYALMKRSDGRMGEYDYSTWHDAVVGLLRGSRAEEDLAGYLSGLGVRWRPRYFDSLAEAERSLRAGELDAVYTLSNSGNRDLVSLAVRPTTLCYFCSNPRKPWIKEDLDRAVAEVLRNDYGWIHRLYSRYLQSDLRTLQLSSAEVDYLRQSPRRIAVSFDRAVAPWLTVNSETGEVEGFLPRLFERFAKRAGMEFELRLPGANADVLVSLEDRLPEGGDIAVDPQWLPVDACFVRRRSVDGRARGIVAVSDARPDDLDFVERNGYTPLPVSGREAGYAAVREGRAEMMLDSIAVACYRIDMLHQYPDLTVQRIDPGVYRRGLALSMSTAEDSRLKAVLDKARDSLVASDYDTMIFEAVYSLTPTVTPSPVPYYLLIGALLALAMAVVALLVVRRRDPVSPPTVEQDHQVKESLARLSPPTEPTRWKTVPPVARPVPSSPVAGSDLASRRVLLVEDNPLNREIARFLLESMGLKVDEAVNGAEAVERVRSVEADHYSWVLMDIQMPVMNGFDAARAIRGFNRSVPLIAMTANAFKEDRDAALAAGMNEHLAKPVKAAVLMSVLRKFI